MKSTYFKIIFSILTVSFLSNAYAQKGAVKRGTEDYRKLSYVDSRKVFKSIAEDGYESAEIFQKVGDTYYFNGRYEEAKEWYDKLHTQFPDAIPPEYHFRYAQTLKALQFYAEADAAMELFKAEKENDSRAKLFDANPDYLSQAEQSDKYDYRLEEIRKINSRLSDFGPSLYEGKLIFASSRDTGRTAKRIHTWTAEPFLDLYETTIADSVVNFTEPVLFGNNLNTKFHESTSTFSKDGTTVYFTRNNYSSSVYKSDKSGINRLKLYTAKRKDNGQWTIAKELPFNSDQFSTAHPTLNRDETKLYFASDREGTIGLSDLWVVDILGEDEYSEPRNLGTTINTEGRESFPHLGSDGTLYFATNGRPGVGGLDVFTTTTENENDVLAWTTPKNVGKPINSPFDDFSFILSDDQTFGYFASNRQQGVGGDDIYRFGRTLLEIPCVVTVEGTVTDAKTGEIIPNATVELFDLDDNQIATVIAKDDGTFNFDQTVCENNYLIRASKEFYDADEEVVETPDTSAQLSLALALKPNRLELSEGDDIAIKLDLNPIYFDFDRYNIRKDAAIELAKVIAVLKEYPEMYIDVRSHTDSRAPDAYNLSLSQKRNNSTIEYIVKKGGISASRLTGRGYGESQLVNECSNGVECTEEQHQLNRRSEFIIVKM